MPFSIFNPATSAPLHQPEPNPFSAFAESQPQLSSAQPAHLPINSFFAPPPTNDVNPYPAKTPSPAPKLEQTSTAPQASNFFNSFDSHAVQSQDFNPFRNQALNVVNDALNDLSFDSDNNNVSAVDNSNNESEQSPVIDEPIQSETSAELDPNSFFNNNFIEDTPVSSASNNTNEFQIQNFFNNPPPLSDTQEVVQDKNFNFIGTNLLNKRIEKIATAAAAVTGTDNSETLSLASYIVEPASSAQSEFSEYAEQPSIDIINRSVDTIYSSAAAAVNQVSFAVRQIRKRKTQKNSFKVKWIKIVISALTTGNE